MEQEGTTNWRDRNRQLQKEWLELDAEQQTALAAGDTARVQQIAITKERNDEEFLALNRGLVIEFAKRFFSPGDANADDYVQDAVLGALEARRKWDISRDVTYATFSRQFIAGRVKRGVRVLEFNQMSNTDFAARKHVLEKSRVLQQKLGRPATEQELAEATGFTIALVNRVRQGRAASLDAPVGDKGETLGDLLLADTVDEIEIDLDDVEVLKAVTAKLSAQELFVITRRAGLDGAWSQSTNEVAALSGLGRGTVSRRDVEARRKLKEAAK